MFSTCLEMMIRYSSCHAARYIICHARRRAAVSCLFCHAHQKEKRTRGITRESCRRSQFATLPPLFAFLFVFVALPFFSPLFRFFTIHSYHSSRIYLVLFCFVFRCHAMLFKTREERHRSTYLSVTEHIFIEELEIYISLVRMSIPCFTWINTERGIVERERKAWHI